MPLEMRLQADGRTNEIPTINENFAKMASAMYNAEKQHRKYLEDKKKLKEVLAFEELKKKKEELQDFLQKAKKEKDSLFDYSQNSIKTKNIDKNESLNEKQRDLLRFMIKKNVERDHKLESTGKLNKKDFKTKEHDVAEKIALGEKLGDFTKTELKVDQKLLNLPSGVNSGFRGDEAYDLYDKPLFKEKVKTNIYQGVKEYNDFNDDDIDQFLKKKEGFRNQSKRNKYITRAKPVEFEKFDSSKKLKKS